MYHTNTSLSGKPNIPVHLHTLAESLKSNVKEYENGGLNREEYPKFAMLKEILQMFSLLISDDNTNL
jgi:hypothetical protein